MDELINGERSVFICFLQLIGNVKCSGGQSIRAAIQCRCSIIFQLSVFDVSLNGGRVNPLTQFESSWPLSTSGRFLALHSINTRKFVVKQRLDRMALHRSISETVLQI